MKSILSALAFLITVSAHAAPLAGTDPTVPEELLVSLRREEARSVAQMSAALPALTQSAWVSEGCYARTVAKDFLVYDSLSQFHWTAVVRIEATCDAATEQVKAALRADRRFTVESNGRVGPTPGVTIRN